MLSQVTFPDEALLRFAALELRWSGVGLAVGLLAGYALVLRAAARWGLSASAVRDAALWSLPEAALAARIGYVVTHPEVYLLAPSRVVQVWDGGFSFGAGLVVGTWALWRYARARQIAPGRLLDAAVPGVVAAQALAALGRALDAASRPAITLPPWHVPPSSADAASSPFALSSGAEWQLGQALWSVALLLAYAGLSRRGARPGLLFLAYLAAEGTARAAVGFRVPPGAAPGSAVAVAWTVLALTAAAGALYHLHGKRH